MANSSPAPRELKPVLRRLDCVLAPTKAKLLSKYEALKGGQVKNLDPVLNRITGVSFHNISKFDFELKGEPDKVAANLRNYIKGFSENAREVLERFGFEAQIIKLDEADLLYQLVVKFAEVDLHPDRVNNHVMGSAFEELIRRFAEQSNETAGEHFTPREVVKLMVALLFNEDEALLTRYLIANPPFGVEWKKVEKDVRDEHEKLGHAGRFGAGLPRINDGSFLFLQHMLAKMKPVDPKTREGGSRIASVFIAQELERSRLCLLGESHG